jgi:hypothetical protein
MMATELTERLDAALREEQPESALHGLVRSLLTEGHRRRELVDALETYRASLVREGRDEDDEAVLDIMAVLDGWASETAVRNLLPPPCVAPHASRLD